MTNILLALFCLFLMLGGMLAMIFGYLRASLATLISGAAAILGSLVVAGLIGATT